MVGFVKDSATAAIGILPPPSPTCAAMQLHKTFARHVYPRIDLPVALHTIIDDIAHFHVPPFISVPPPFSKLWCLKSDRISEIIFGTLFSYEASLVGNRVRFSATKKTQK